MSKTAVVTGRPVNLFGHQPIKNKTRVPTSKEKRSKIPKETLTPKISACLIEFIDFDFSTTLISLKLFQFLSG